MLILDVMPRYCRSRQLKEGRTLSIFTRNTLIDDSFPYIRLASLFGHFAGSNRSSCTCLSLGASPMLTTLFLARSFDLPNANDSTITSKFQCINLSADVHTLPSVRWIFACISEPAGCCSQITQLVAVISCWQPVASSSCTRLINGGPGCMACAEMVVLARGSKYWLMQQLVQLN